MPKRTDIKRILVIGSGPIVIGQACEFDYSGAQACKVLKEDGYEVVLVNSNPATIMTDPSLADRTYVEPITAEFIERVIAKEHPDALLPTLGGQTGLNAAVELAKSGVLDRYGVEMIGCDLAAIERGEDRKLFAEAMEEIGLECARSGYAYSVEDAVELAGKVGYPCVLRPSFTLGGAGGGIAYDEQELREIVAQGLELSPAGEVLVEESIIGWKEDFNMAFQDPIAGQLEAIRYLHEAASHFPGMLYLGGHSKGGNLAVYSAVKSDPSIRRRILDVYSHDGPGFLKSFFELPEYEQMKDRIHKTVPQSSLVGMLFETQEDYKVVKSRAFSLFQHDPASWVVNGNDFAYANHLNSGARHMDETLNTWILGLSPADRERFVDTLFELLNSTDVFSTEELVQNWSANLQILMQAARALDPESREFLQRTIRDLFTISLKTIPDRFRKK